MNSASLSQGDHELENSSVDKSDDRSTDGRSKGVSLGSKRSRPVLYVLHSGNLYGTERMALATIAELGHKVQATIVAPPGPALVEARRLGYEVAEFTSTKALIPIFWRYLSRHKTFAFIATGVTHSLLMVSLNALQWRRLAHLHLVHGGTDERLSYGRKKWLNRLPIALVAVSDFVKSRLVFHGVKVEKISVIENFLADDYAATIPKRPALVKWTLSQVVVISRIDPIKRIDILLDALDIEPRLATLEFKIFGHGSDFDKLSLRAEQHPNVQFLGFQTDAVQALQKADLLLHLCPTEPFGLAILEAMTAEVPILLPNAGGAGNLIKDGKSGLHFEANSPRSLADKLLFMQETGTSDVPAMVKEASLLLDTRYSPSQRSGEYFQLIDQLLKRK